MKQDHNQKRMMIGKIIRHNATREIGIIMATTNNPDTVKVAFEHRPNVMRCTDTSLIHYFQGVRDSHRSR